MVDQTVETTPFISVVVPIHNEEIGLPTCLSALMQQTHPTDRYEIILVDDGSTDNSSHICREFVSNQQESSPKVTYARIKKSGLSVARNTGIYLSQGELVAIIDGDAVADSDWLMEIQKPFSDERVGVVGGRIELLNKQSSVARFLHIVRHHQMFGPKEYKNHLIGTNVAYRRMIFDQVGGFHEEFSGYRGEEVCLHRLISRHYLTANAPDAVVYHNRPEFLCEWLRIEFKDGCSQPLVEQAPLVKRMQLKYIVLCLEKILIATLPFWAFALLFFKKKRLIALLGLISGCVGIARRHLFKKSSYEVRQRLRKEFPFPLAGVVYTFVDWLSMAVKMTGWLFGLWVHRDTQLSTVYPHGERIELVITNRESTSEPQDRE